MNTWLSTSVSGVDGWVLLDICRSWLGGEGGADIDTGTMRVGLAMPCALLDMHHTDVWQM